MTEWLHEIDVLEALVNDPEPVGSWARLQCLGRGVPRGLPGGMNEQGVAAALRPEGLDTFGAAQIRADGGHIEDLLLAARWLGAVPSDPTLWTEAVRPHLGGRHGAEAADLLAILGGFRSADLGPLVLSFPDHPLLPMWVLRASQHPDRVASDLASHLANQADGGERSLIEVLGWMVDWMPPDLGSERSAFDAARRAFGASEPAGRGSFKRLLRAHLADLCDSLPHGLGGVVRHWMKARGDAPLPGAVVWSVVQCAHDEALNPGRQHHPIPFELAVNMPAYALYAASSVSTDPSMLSRFDDCFDSTTMVWLAGYVPTVDVLERLLRTPVEEDPLWRENFMSSLARMGSPAALPLLEALSAHVNGDVVAEAKQLMHGLLGRAW